MPVALIAVLITAGLVGIAGLAVTVSAMKLPPDRRKHRWLLGSGLTFLASVAALVILGMS
ncbi:MAG: hypothetical protein QM831_34620 [Kofleriaceae bacterium]